MVIRLTAASAVLVAVMTSAAYAQRQAPWPESLSAGAAPSAGVAVLVGPAVSPGDPIRSFALASGAAPSA